jgi:hypothetical protein
MTAFPQQLRKLRMKMVCYYPFTLNEEIPPGLPEPPGEPFNRIETKVLAEQIQKAIDELAARAAAGEADAVEPLYELAVSATTQLGNLARRAPELVRPIAVGWPVFPVVSSPKDERTRSAKKLLASLGVANGLGREYSPKSRWSLENTPTQYAVAMQFTIHFNRRLFQLQRSELSADEREQLDRETARFPGVYRRAIVFPAWVERAARLPEFNRDSAAEWFEVGWLALMEKTDNHPENVKELRLLGQYRAKHTSTAKRGSKTEASNIRDGIKEKIKRAMVTVAPESSPPPQA